MKYFKINSGLLYTVIISFYILRFACSNYVEDIFLMYFIPTFWIIIFIYLKSNSPFENRLNITQTQQSFFSVIIIITLYFLLNFALGLFLSYSKNPYSPKALTYIWKYVFYIFFQEYARFRLVSDNKHKLINRIFIIALFVFIQVDPIYFLNSLQNEKIIEYAIYILIPIILESLILTYFVNIYDSGYILSSAYRIYMGLYVYLIPVYPNLRKDSVLMLKILLILVLFFKTAIKDKSIRKRSIFNRKYSKKNNRIFYSAVFAVSLVTIIFISGITKYFPLAITSGSMYSNIEVGDIVIVKKIDRECAISSLKEGDVIIYRLNNVLVVHRIMKVEKSPINSEPYFITKGDNNQKPDKEKVYLKQIVGITKYKISYLGYPAILFRKYLF